MLEEMSTVPYDKDVGKFYTLKIENFRDKHRTDNATSFYMHIPQIRTADERKFNMAAPHNTR